MSSGQGTDPPRDSNRAAFVIRSRNGLVVQPSWTPSRISEGYTMRRGRFIVGCALIGAGLGRVLGQADRVIDECEALVDSHADTLIDLAIAHDEIAALRDCAEYWCMRAVAAENAGR